MKKLIFISIVVLTALTGCTDKEKEAKDIKVNQVISDHKKELELEKTKGVSADFRELRSKK